MSPLRILVIDDSPEVRQAVRMALMDAGFAVSEAANGTDGIEAARRINPDCILLGCRLPDMEGLAVLEKLIADPVTPGAAVVMLTGADDEAIASLALKKGAQDYLAKSRLDPHDLRRVVSNAIGRLELLRSASASRRRTHWRRTRPAIARSSRTKRKWSAGSVPMEP